MMHCMRNVDDDRSIGEDNVLQVLGRINAQIVIGGLL